MASSDDGISLERRWRFDDVAEEPIRLLPPIEGYQHMPLVALEEAIKPLVKHIEEIEKYANEAKVKCMDGFEDKLTVDESAAIFLYTMEWKGKKTSLYTVLNTNLRSEDRASLKDWFLYLRLFLNGIMKIPPSLKRLYRGVRLNLAERYKQGESVVWWAFSSCTDDIKVAERFCGKDGPRTIFQIESDLGIDIRKYSRYPIENEILLVAARYMQVVSNTTQQDDLTVICLKETISPYKLISLPTDGSPPPPPPPSVIPKYFHTPFGKAVKFENQRIFDQDMSKDVKDVIEQDQCIRLDICHCQLEPGCFETLGKAITESVKLVQVNLYSNRISSRDISLLAPKLSLNPTHTVSISICFCCTRQKNVASGQIQVLDLSDNEIDDDGAKQLANLVKVKQSLIHLDLNSNKIGDEGVQALAGALSNERATLKRLYLEKNIRITDVGANELAEMLKINQSLERLSLMNCRLDYKSRQTLIQVADTKQGFHLNIER